MDLCRAKSAHHINMVNYCKYKSFLSNTKLNDKKFTFFFFDGGKRLNSHDLSLQLLASFGSLFDVFRSSWLSSFLEPFFMEDLYKWTICVIRNGEA